MADYQVTNEEFYELLDGIFNEVETSSDEEKKIKKQIVFPHSLTTIVAMIQIIRRALKSGTIMLMHLASS